MDVLYYDALWRPKKNGQNTSREFWDGRADHFSTNAYRKSAAERVGKLIAVLTEKGMLAKNLPIPDGPSKAQKEFIENYLKTLDEDGSIKQKVKMKFAWI
ncbi:MAG: hypothetical protein NUV45_07600 [Tepidanaerobacteraceae bacterium]|jgi:hypothetical protein|nr:hypothetical protein [Tepidanaerobacteraceae bacterium]